jgi:transposase
MVPASWVPLCFAGYHALDVRRGVPAPGLTGSPSTLIVLATWSYQSGQVDYDGHISRRGDRHVRSLLYEAATVILTRSSAESGLRTWGLALKARVGVKRAAVARKLAVTMHAMLKSGERFDRTAGAVA